MIERDRLVVPQVHLNGDTEETLLKGMEEASMALHAAQDALRMMAPNARNYYTLGDKAYRQAADQYREMCKRIADTQAEIEAIAIGVQDRKDYVDHPLKGE